MGHERRAHGVVRRAEREAERSSATPISEREFGCFVRPALKLGDGHEAVGAAADEAELGLDVALEGIDGHADGGGGLGAGERDPGHDSRDGGRGTHRAAPGLWPGQ